MTRTCRRHAFCGMYAGPDWTEPPGMVWLYVLPVKSEFNDLLRQRASCVGCACSWMCTMQLDWTFVRTLVRVVRIRLISQYWQLCASRTVYANEMMEHLYLFLFTCCLFLLVFRAVLVVRIIWILPNVCILHTSNNLHIRKKSENVKARMYTQMIWWIFWFGPWRSVVNAHSHTN